MKLKKFLKLSFLGTILFFAKPVLAVCPVCIVAVSACVGLSEYLGIDDSISGLWIGGLLVAMIIWTIDWLKKKDIKFYGRKILITLLFYVFTIGPLYRNKFIGNPTNKLWGMDKLLLGIILGSIFFLLAVFINNWLKKKNGGKVFFPFQKVAVPIAILGILNIIFYFLTC
ncbi:MAG TPA: hypothetical protein P5232_03180 [Candidatus Moranbacteria bacterium]|nr:hypothetical protein [Candidatus Moranbacteria bacterium]